MNDTQMSVCLKSLICLLCSHTFQEVSGQETFEIIRFATCIIIISLIYLIKSMGPFMRSYS